jgi:hypothetical protein
MWEDMVVELVQVSKFPFRGIPSYGHVTSQAVFIAARQAQTNLHQRGDRSPAG